MTDFVSALIICLFLPITTALKVMLWQLLNRAESEDNV